jgi:hypothetical protein
MQHDLAFKASDMYLYMGDLGLTGFLMAALFGCLPLMLVLFALIDILTSNFRDSNTKLIWVIVVIFVPLLGSILYLIMGRKEKIPPTDKF